MAIPRAVLGFKNKLINEFTSGATEDVNYPFDNCRDYKTNTEWSPAANSGTLTITLLVITGLGATSAFGYFGIMSRNAASAGLSVTVRGYDLTSALVKTVTITSFTDGMPAMSAFDNFLCSQIQIDLTWTSKLYVTTLAAGEAMWFDRTVSLGYQPARFAIKDKVQSFITEGNNVVQGRRIRGMKQEEAEVKLQKFNDVAAWYKDYANHVLDSKTLWFMANDQIPTQIIHGVQSPSKLQDLAYSRPDKADLKFSIEGWA
jgi:hypothetical protein